MTLFYEAVSSFGECGLPCGLRGSLCTLHLCRSALHLRFLHSCNTRYEWLVRPYSAGTFTPQEAPSFAWRTNAFASAAASRIRSHSVKAARGLRSRWWRLLAVFAPLSCHGLFP